MKKFLYKTIIVALPVFLLLIFVNYFGDAAHLFDENYEKKMAKITASGYYVTNILNYDERLYQKELILDSAIHPDVVVIGSSRAMFISTDFFPGTSLFNNSVSGASIEDIIGIYQMYKDQHKLPAKIILGIDPWIFNENNGQKRWESIGSYFYEFQNVHNYKKEVTSKYKELLSFSYFQSSLKSLPNYIKGNNNPRPAKSRFNVSTTKLTDGSLVYDKAFREASDKEIEDKIKSYISDKLYSIEDFKEISQRNWGLFNKLILDMRNNNVDVEFFLAPYAPMVYDKIEKEYPMVLKTEKAITDYAKANAIKFYGSFNPYELHLDKRNFYDGMHCKEAGIKKILMGG